MSLKEDRKIKKYDTAASFTNAIRAADHLTH